MIEKVIRLKQRLIEHCVAPLSSLFCITRGIFQSASSTHASQANQQPFQADLASYSACITLNCCPTTQQAEVYRGGQCANDARHLSALVVHESSALQHMQPQLKNKVMRSVRYESEQQCGGVFVVRTNS